MSNKICEDEDLSTACVPIAVLVDPQAVYPVASDDKSKARMPCELPPSAPSVRGSFVEARTPKEFVGSDPTAQERRREPPSWPTACAAMLVYHVFSFVLCVASISLCLMSFLTSVILLPFCCLGLVVLHVHGLLMDSLLMTELVVHNSTLSVMNRHDLLLDIPSVELVFFPQQSGVADQLKELFSMKTLAKWALLLVHCFAAVWTPVSTLATKAMGSYGSCPAAHVLFQLTGYVAHRFP